MAYNDKNILLDAGGKPIPQYWDGSDYQPMGKEFKIQAVGVQSSASFTRPENTTAYEAGDVVCNSTTSPNVMTFSGIGTADKLISIAGAMLVIANNAVPAVCAGYRLHLYTILPTAINDAAPYDLTSGDLSKYAGWIDFGIPTLFTSNCVAIESNLNHMIKLAGTALYGILQCKGAETPGSAKEYSIYLKAFEL